MFFCDIITQQIKIYLKTQFVFTQLKIKEFSFDSIVFEIYPNEDEWRQELFPDGTDEAQYTIAVQFAGNTFGFVITLS